LVVLFGYENEDYRHHHLPHKQAPEGKKLSQTDLAQRMGVTQQTIQKWAKGKTSPSMESVDKLSEITGYAPYWFMLPPDEGDQVVTPDAMKLGPMQLDLLKTFNAFPEEDQQKDALRDERAEGKHG
jgi:transcriptional regulator with XRE-family HTH domain